MTGKGVRWGRTVGRSAPTFMAASTTASPPRLIARQADVGLQLLFRCEAGHLWPFVLRPVPDGASAGCVACGALFGRLLFACLPLCLPCPLPFSTFLPPFILLCPVHLFARPYSIPCAPGSSCSGQQFTSCENCPIGSCNTGLQWRPVHRSILTLLFPAESMILGLGLV